MGQDSDAEHVAGDLPTRANPLEPLRGDERLAGTGHGNGLTVTDFWRWAFSDLVTNTNRGALAEFIVGHAVGALTQPRDPWTEYDLLTPEGIRIEVKSSAYLQSWNHAKPSRISFSIARARRWGQNPVRLVGEPKRHSDVYVFCVLAQRERSTLNPLDLEQWEFYVLPTPLVDRELGDHKTLGCSTLSRLGAARLTYGQLAEAVREAAAEG